MKKNFFSVVDKNHYETKPETVILTSFVTVAKPDVNSVNKGLDSLHSKKIAQVL